MRLKKGSGVEVLNRRETPSGSWCTAKILSGNGRYYDVMYDHSSTVERVPKKVIRPCPPPVGGVKCWLQGDIVEVFENYSWKIAEVVDVMGGGYYVVRLVGSTEEFRVHVSDLRVRQSWQDKEWFLIGKDAGKWKPDRCQELSAKRSYKKSSCRNLLPQIKMKVCTGDGHLLVEKTIDFQEPIESFVYARTKKRKSGPLSHADTTVGASRKVRAVEKAVRPHLVVRGPSPPLQKKVDAVASPHKSPGENYMHASFKDRTIGYCELDTESRNPDAQTRSFFARSIGPNDAEGSVSSVASCSSIGYLPQTFPFHSRAYCSKKFESPSDDAESFCGWESGRKSSSPRKEELAAEIHKLELHAYRSTMEALYALGTLSWEQEALMTNLRLNLHISIDEHLLELRQLASA